MKKKARLNNLLERFSLRNTEVYNITWISVLPFYSLEYFF